MRIRVTPPFNEIVNSSFNKSYLSCPFEAFHHVNAASALDLQTCRSLKFNSFLPCCLCVSRVSLAVEQIVSNDLLCPSLPFLSSLLFHFLPFPFLFFPSLPWSKPGKKRDQNEIRRLGQPLPFGPWPCPEPGVKTATDSTAGWETLEKKIFQKMNPTGVFFY